MPQGKHIKEITIFPECTVISLDGGACVSYKPDTLQVIVTQTDGTLKKVKLEELIEAYQTQVKPL